MEKELADLGNLSIGLALDDSKAAELLQLFVETCQVDLQQLTTAINSNDLGTAADAAHSMKGAALSLGLSELARQAQETERCAREGAGSSLQQHALDLGQRLRQIARAVGSTEARRAPSTTVMAGTGDRNK